MNVILHVIMYVIMYVIVYVITNVIMHVIMHVIMNCMFNILFWQVCGSHEPFGWWRFLTSSNIWTFSRHRTVSDCVNLSPRWSVSGSLAQDSFTWWVTLMPTNQTILWWVNLKLIEQVNHQVTLKVWNQSHRWYIWWMTLASILVLFIRDFIRWNCGSYVIDVCGKLTRSRTPVTHFTNSTTDKTWRIGSAYTSR